MLLFGVCSFWVTSHWKIALYVWDKLALSDGCCLILVSEVYHKRSASVPTLLMCGLMNVGPVVACPFINQHRIRTHHCRLAAEKSPKMNFQSPEVWDVMRWSSVSALFAHSLRALLWLPGGLENSCNLQRGKRWHNWACIDSISAGVLHSPDAAHRTGATC